MGADLYIRSISEPARLAHTPAFEAAARKRNERSAALKAAGVSYDAIESDPVHLAAQAEVDAAYAAMYPESGYFRDAYNVSSVLNKCGLSWWKDIVPMLNSKGFLSPRKAKALIALIEQRPLQLPTLKELVDGHADVTNGVASWHELYRSQRQRLIAFLQRAVDMKESIYCSL